MTSQQSRALAIVLAAILAPATACDQAPKSTPRGAMSATQATGSAGGAAAVKRTAPAAAKAAAPAIKAGRGVDLATKTVRIGALTDESGPAAVIGKPYAVGKRILAAQVNAGGSGLLPEGWKVELVEKDHGYNPGKSEQAYKEIKDNVLFLGHSFGTPNTLPLLPYLKSDNVVAFPASLSSEMAANTHTPPAGPSYVIEAMRGMDYVVEAAGGADKVKAAVVADQTDYGKDGVKGWKAAAAHHKVNVVAEQTVAPGQKDFTAVVAALKNAGATHVLLTILPSSTGPLLGTAAKMGYAPVWLGNTPSWIDAFFAHPKLPAPVFANFHWLNGMSYWGEDVPGMAAFLEAFKAHAPKGTRPDFYVLVSYAQGLIEMQALSNAIESKDVTPAGFLAGVQAIKGYDANGMFQPVDLTAVPYVVSTRARVLKPDFTAKTWAVASNYDTPAAHGGAVAAVVAPAAAPAAEKATD